MLSYRNKTRVVTSKELRNEYRYTIENLQRDYVLAATNDLERANHLWYRIPRRKHTDLVMVDQTTGEIMKMRERRYKEWV